MERAGRWDIDLHAHQHPQRTSALRSPSRGAPDRITLHHIARLQPSRLRTQSSISTNSSLGSACPPHSSLSISPQPRVQIPFLSFFAALLSLDSDDPVLRLLTQATPPDDDAILFPGHRLPVASPRTSAMLISPVWSPLTPTGVLPPYTGCRSCCCLVRMAIQ